MWGWVERWARRESQREGRGGIRDFVVCMWPEIRGLSKPKGRKWAWVGRRTSGGLGLWLGGWQCQAGTEVVPASAPPPGLSSLGSALSARPGAGCACPTACGWGRVDRACLDRANNGFQTSQLGTKGCLSGRVCVPGWGQGQPGWNPEGAVPW